jgi:glycosyltransferase involved in cell wall biosynthesis
MNTPRVSVVIPARDEAPYITACVRSVMAQSVDGGLEVVVVDGCSKDGTPELARAAGATVLINEKQTIPTALNKGLAAAQGEVLVRFDAHAEMPEGYIEKCLNALTEEVGATNVGGWREAHGFGPWGRAVGAALSSRLGVGNPRIWRPPGSGEIRRDVETVPLGCFPVDVLRDAGGWQEELLVNEDFELNHRLQRAGGRIVFDPAIWSVYRPRESLAAIARQYWRYGRWKAVVLAREPRSLRLRQLAPVALLATATAAVIPWPLARAARAALAHYGALLTVAAARSAAGWRTGPVLGTMHLSWAAGLSTGLLAEATRALRSSR